MCKKSLIILSIFFCALFISTISFATTSNIKSTINNGTNAVVDGVNKLGSDVRNGVGAVENGIEDAFTDDDNMANNNNNNDATIQSATSTRTQNGYVSTRAGDTANANATDTNTIWVWIVLIIAAIVVIGLVWYYSTQDNK